MPPLVRSQFKLRPDLPCISWETRRPQPTGPTPQLYSLHTTTKYCFSPNAQPKIASSPCRICYTCCDPRKMRQARAAPAQPLTSEEIRVSSYLCALIIASSTALKSSSPSPLPRACRYAALAADATGSVCACWSPSWMASRMSFCWCFRGNAGAYLCAIMLGPFMANMGAAMAPRPSTSSRSCCFRPDCSASARPSANATIMEPMIMLTTSFMLAPAPTSPRKKDALPMAPSGPATASNSAWSPAVRKMSLPSSAGFLEPDTGASRKAAPEPRTAAAMACDVSASTVLTST
mmetsp:Transcript_28204/g.71915  ORF Transcript_28204/g.71915 Transcript_28204/m.71915 type:complete len:291 (-) Transcript_28204:480-1352(-)